MAIFIMDICTMATYIGAQRVPGLLVWPFFHKDFLLRFLANFYPILDLWKLKGVCLFLSSFTLPPPHLKRTTNELFAFLNTSLGSKQAKWADKNLSVFFSLLGCKLTSFFDDWPIFGENGCRECGGRNCAGRISSKSCFVFWPFLARICKLRPPLLRVKRKWFAWHMRKYDKQAKRICTEPHIRGICPPSIASWEFSWKWA